MGSSRNLEDLETHLLKLGANKLSQLTSLRNVNLIEHHNLRTLMQRHGHTRSRVNLIVLQLTADHLKVTNRVAARLQSSAVNHMHKSRRTLHMAQEAVTQTAALRSALNQTRNIRDGVANIARLHHTQVRNQSGERVVSNLRTRRRNRSNQRRLTRRGVTHQSHIRNGLELQNNISLFTGGAQQSKTGSLTLSRSQRSVTQTAHTATGSNILVAHTQQVSQNITLAVLHHSTLRHGQNQVLTVKAVVHIATTNIAIRGVLMRAVVVLQQGRGLVIHAQNHRATITTVTAVRAAQGLKLFTSHGDAAVTSATARYMQDHAVHEFCHGFSLSWKIFTSPPHGTHQSCCGCGSRRDRVGVRLIVEPSTGVHGIRGHSERG